MDALRKDEHYAFTDAVVSRMAPQKYTYTDYTVWDDNMRYELIDGVPYMMSPAPSRTHQRILGKLHNQFYNFLKGKSCEVFLAPFDVRLNSDTSDDTVVQPDLLVVCDASKLDEKCCTGAPDFIAEILSPSSSKHDKLVKFNKYLEAGVREYWIIDPIDKTLTVHLLENSKYVTSAYSDEAVVSLHVLDGCVISLPDVFGA